MHELYPHAEPDATGWLDVGDGHRIYWETSGSPDGKPAVVLHGGPGSGSSPLPRRHFDPAAYRIVQFDQRGAGRSTPRGGLAANTTWHLVADLEALREHLGIERWLILGGSWGATLALAYAQRHPERVSELVLRGVFTARRSELDWLYRGGAAQLYPEAWSRYLEPLAEPERADPLAAYRKLLGDPDPAVRERAAVAWSGWEGAIVSVVPQPRYLADYRQPGFAATFAGIALHYFANDAWLDDGQLIRDAGKLAGIPGVIVQGRFDAVCPPVTAYELHHAWAGSRLVLLDNAGHAVTDPGILGALRDATDGFRPR